MNDLTRDSDRILSESKALVRDNREGGRHRRAPSIGQGSAKAKRDHLMKKVRNQQMVGRTELWLEAQRPALPPPAAQIVGDMGVQLDALGLQLEGLDQNHPKAREVRSLVGEQLPQMIDSYQRIPAHLRQEERAGATPDQQLTDSLGKISGEIDSITRQLAEGSLDDLAIKHRYLDYKFGEGAQTSPQLEHKN